MYPQERLFSNMSEIISLGI